MFTDNIVPPITILIGCMLVWWWPAIRIALRIPGYRPRIVTDMGVGFAQIALPPSWRHTTSLPGHAALQAADRFHCRYVMVISESLEDFDQTVDLQAYSLRVLAMQLQSLEVSGIRGPFELEISSHGAVQYEYSARVNGQKITYLHTTVAGRRAFHQVIGWSASSNFNRRAFEQVLDGFAEQPGAVPERDPGPSRIQPDPAPGYTIH